MSSVAIPRATVVRALEAIEAGELDLAVGLLKVALEERPARLPIRCGDCGRRFQFPGQHDAHLDLCWGARRAA